MGYHHHASLDPTSPESWLFHYNIRWVYFASSYDYKSFIKGNRRCTLNIVLNKWKGVTQRPLPHLWWKVQIAFFKMLTLHYTEKCTAVSVFLLHDRRNIFFMKLLLPSVFGLHDYTGLKANLVSYSFRHKRKWKWGEYDKSGHLDTVADHYGSGAVKCRSSTPRLI